LLKAALRFSPNRLVGGVEMSAGRKFKQVAGMLVVCLGVLCTGIANPANAATSQTQRKSKTKKKAPLPVLPSGPMGPVQPVPLDSIAPVPPQVDYRNAQLTIVAPNSTLGDILRAVRKQTGAEIDIPVATERVATHLGPGPAREVVAELLNGSRFNYVLLGSPADAAALTRVVLVAKSGPENPAPTPGNPPAITEEQTGVVRMTGNPGAPQPEIPPDATDAEATDDTTAEENADQAAAEADQPVAPPDQPAVKTPQQMLQEMQQRQMQLQQQQPPGQQPIPGAGIPQQPPPQEQR
jgi:hypothetical protein